MRYNNLLLVAAGAIVISAFSNMIKTSNPDGSLIAGCGRTCQQTKNLQTWYKK
jgi:hypothetical protein